MNKTIISSRREDASVFLQCDCGNEIIQVFYYKQTTTCEEIISLAYYGYLEEIKNNSYTRFAFDQVSFKLFIEALQTCAEKFVYSYVITDRSPLRLYIDKDRFGFTKLTLYMKPFGRTKLRKVWDISIREQALLEFIEELKKIYEKIMEDNLCYKK